MHIAHVANQFSFRKNAAPRFSTLVPTINLGVSKFMRLMPSVISLPELYPQAKVLREKIGLLHLGSGTGQGGKSFILFLQSFLSDGGLVDGDTN